MNPILSFLAAMLVIGLLLIPLVAAFRLVTNRRRFLGTLRPAVNSLTAGVHAGGHVSKLSAAAIATSYLLAKKGADEPHMIVCSAAGEKSSGVITDQAEAAEAPINVAYHGGANGTRLVRAGAAIAVGDELTPLANGKAQPLPGTTGTYWVFGEALTAAADGETCEYAPCKAQPRAVA